VRIDGSLTTGVDKGVADGGFECRSAKDIVTDIGNGGWSVGSDGLFPRLVPRSPDRPCQHVRVVPSEHGGLMCTVVIRAARNASKILKPYNTTRTRRNNTCNS
jgi:hypothetical protein